MILYSRDAPEAGNKTVKIEGQVNDEAGMPLPGVNVFIKGTTVGTVTDMNGNYLSGGSGGDGYGGECLPLLANRLGR